MHGDRAQVSRERGGGGQTLRHGRLRLSALRLDGRVPGPDPAGGPVGVAGGVGPAHLAQW